ncbi:MAG: ABC transporter permease [Halobacteriaceae archaeon]
MSLRSFLRKEAAWARRRVVPLALLFLVLPTSFAYVTTGFDNVLPTDTPVAVVAQSEDVTEDDIAIARGALAFFSDPRTYGANETAFRALAREQVYAVVTVPPGITNTSVQSTVRVYVHGSMVPYHQPSEAVVSVLRFRLQDVLSGSIEIRRVVVGTTHSLSAYLVPSFLVILVMLLALAYLPYNLAGEEAVIDRIRVESSITTLVVSKLVFLGALLVLPLAVFQAASLYFGYAVTIGPGVILACLLLFVALGALAAAVTLATGFSTWGFLANLLGLFALLLFSGLLYPAGFFSPVRREVVRLIPTHYAAILVRSTALRGATIPEYAAWYAGLGGLCVVGILALGGAVRLYERRAAT